MNKKSKIAITIDKSFDEKMDNESINKSKLINFLLKKCLSDNQEVINKFKKKVG